MMYVRCSRRLVGNAGFVVAAIAGAIMPVRLPAQRATLEAMISDTVLGNGLHVIAVRNPAVPLATIEIVVRTGAFSQLTPEDEGVPHLLEHMLFKSGEGSLGGSFGSEAAKADAITHNGVTAEEAVTYYVTVPSKNLAKGVKVMADLVRTVSFEADALKSEQKVVSGELQRKAAEPQYLLHHQSSMVLWGDGWGRKNPGGNLLAVMGATPDRLKGFFRKYYVPNNAAVVVTGDVTAADVFAQVGKSFQSWKAADDPFKDAPVVPMPPLTATKTQVVEADVTDLTFLIRWHGPSVTTDARGTYAADVFSELVNQPLSGLQRRLIDSGLFQSVSVSYETQRNVGPIELYARTTPEKLEAAGAALKKEIRDFASPGYFTDEDVAFAKKRQQVITTFQLETATSLAHPIATLWSVAGLDYYLDYVDNVRAQTPQDVHKFVQTYLAGKPMTVSVLVSPVTRRAMRGTLDGILSKWSVE
jgi:zinc protease